MIHQSERVYVQITGEKLDLEGANYFVQDDEAGAINLFVGATRNHHDGKKVTELYYDCYPEMALKELSKLSEDIFQKYGLKKLWAAHRTGLVPIGEASVIIAASSAHRKGVFGAVSEIMDLIKKDVPIWKRESFENETLWKEEQMLKKGFPND